MRASIKSQFSDSAVPGPEVVPAKKVVGTIDELIALLFDAQHCDSGTVCVCVCRVVFP
jgi:hypothetical protein